MTTLSHEAFMGSLSQDTTILQDNDAIRVLDGPQPMSNNHGCSIPHHRPQSFLYLGLGEGIYTGSGFIEDQDTGIF
jgi:hypothetical protein